MSARGAVADDDFKRRAMEAYKAKGKGATVQVRCDGDVIGEEEQEKQGTGRICPPARPAGWLAACLPHIHTRVLCLYVYVSCGHSAAQMGSLDCRWGSL